MKQLLLTKHRIYVCLVSLVCCSATFGNATQTHSTPLVYDNIVIPECLLYADSANDIFFSFRLRLADDFKGRFSVDRLVSDLETHKVLAISPDTAIVLNPMIDMQGRICEFVSETPIKKGNGYVLKVPAGILKVMPVMEEVDEIDIDADDLTSMSMAGAWHKAGGQWGHQGMFSVIDDDSVDGQIPSSKPAPYTYGYWSLLYPVLESLDIKGNLAVVGRKIGIDNTPPNFNDNGKTLIRLQDEKGWSLFSHSMECLGEFDNNWMVDSLESPLCYQILKEGPNKGYNPLTVSVYDMQTRRQYWPNADNTGWEETPKRYIKPYVCNYETHRNVMYNPDFDVDWHWGATKTRAEELGLNYIGFVTHNSTSSHALVGEIVKVFPLGLSDIGAVNINYPPMLSSGVRSGLEGQSLGNYDGNSKDNTFNDNHYRKFCAQVDEAAEKGGWIIFNMHTYREVWENRLPGALVSEGGSYPDDWVIPMKGMDSANDPLTPPAHLGISDWSEWYPCPGTRLEMMWKVLKYAKEKGLKPVTCAEGFGIMGNKVSVGYFNNGYKFGMDIMGLIDTEDIYPHYIVSATDEVSYYNPLVSEEYLIDIDDPMNVDVVESASSGRFLINDETIVWNTPDPTCIMLRVMDSTGKQIAQSHTNSICIDKASKGVFIICAVRSGAILGAVKTIR